MDKVKIKRVKRNKKEITTQEKILAGVGVGSALLGVAGAVASQPKDGKVITRETSAKKGSSKAKAQELIGKVFGDALGGIKTARAAEESEAETETDEGNTQAENPDTRAFEPTGVMTPATPLIEESGGDRFLRVAVMPQRPVTDSPPAPVAPQTQDMRRDIPVISTRAQAAVQNDASTAGVVRQNVIQPAPAPVQVILPSGATATLQDDAQTQTQDEAEGEQQEETGDVQAADNGQTTSDEAEQDQEDTTGENTEQETESDTEDANEQQEETETETGNDSGQESTETEETDTETPEEQDTEEGEAELETDVEEEESGGQGATGSHNAAGQQGSISTSDLQNTQAAGQQSSIKLSDVSSTGRETQNQPQQQYSSAAASVSQGGNFGSGGGGMGDHPVDPLAGRGSVIRTAGLQMPMGNNGTGQGLQMPGGYAASGGGALAMAQGLQMQEDALAQAPAAAETTYRVKKGDSLWSISQKYYGDGRQWRKIFIENKDIIKNPSLLRVGMTLKVPDASQPLARQTSPIQQAPVMRVGISNNTPAVQPGAQNPAPAPTVISQSEADTSEVESEDTVVI